MSTTVAPAVVKQELLETVQHLVLELAQSLPDDLHDLSEAEELIRTAVLELGGRVLQGWSETAAAGTLAPVCECGRKMRHKGYVEGSLVTTLGDVRVRRARLRCTACGQEKYPHDDSLRFLSRNVSPPLAKVISRMGSQLPFDTARQNLKEDYSVGVCKRTAQRVCEEAGCAMLALEDTQRTQLQSLPPQVQLESLPDSELTPENTYVYADGAMLHSDGDWREIKVGSVASFDAQGNRIAIDHRARLLNCQDFGWELMLMARQAGYHRARLKAFVADGARWLWDQAATHFPDAVQILDWYHLAEHVHQAANVLYGEGSQEAERFSQQRLKELWEGRSSQTLRKLKELHKKTRSRNKREELRKLRGYLTNNRQRINYPRYRALGLTIGSGQVESAYKHLVGAHCKQAGMRNWTPDGAQGVLRIRAAHQTNHFNHLWQNLTKTAA